MKKNLVLKNWIIKNYYSIKFKLLLSYIGISIIPIIIMGIIFYSISINIIQQKVSKSTLDQLNKINAVIEQRIGNVKNFTKSFASNSQINIILNEKMDSYDYDDTNTIISFLNSGLETADIIDSIYVYTNTGHIYKAGETDNLRNSDIVNSDWFPKIKNDPKKESLYWLGIDNSFLPKPHIAIVRRLNYILNKKNFGFIYIGISVKSIYPRGKSQGYFFIIDENALVISHRDEDKIGMNLRDEEYIKEIFTSHEGYFVEIIGDKKYLIVFSTLDSTGWKIVEKISIEAINKEIITVKKIFIFVVLGLTLMVISISLIVSKRISEPIKKITELTKKIEQGQLNVKVEMERKDEIGSLAKSFNRMVVKIQELINQVYIQEQKKKEIEIEVLQAQISPHFLYNTLGAIKWMSIIHNVQSINDMITALIKLLKQGLSSSNTFITLEEEINSIQHYVYILNVRFNNGITLTYDLPEDLKKIQIFKFLLQPLVENAIMHGIKTNGGIGTIHIKCYRELNYIKIIVSDDGIGISDDKLSFIFEKPDICEKGDQSIGICNVLERINLSFGDPCGLEIKSEIGKGTDVIITIPAGV